MGSICLAQYIQNSFTSLIFTNRIRNKGWSKLKVILGSRALDSMGEKKYIIFLYRWELAASLDKPLSYLRQRKKESLIQILCSMLQNLLLLLIPSYLLLSLYSLQSYSPWAECGMLNLWFGSYVVLVFTSNWLPTFKIWGISSKKTSIFLASFEKIKNSGFTGPRNCWLEWSSCCPLRPSMFSIVPTSPYCLILFPLHLLVFFA